MFRNYKTILNDLVNEKYHPYWPHFLDSLTDDEYIELASEYWNCLSKHDKQKWMADDDFQEVLSGLISGALRYDIDDTMFSARIFMEELKDFFIDEVITGLEKSYFRYEYKSLHDSREDDAREMIRHQEVAVNY